MGYVVYNAETTRLLSSKTFATESAAKAARTRAAKADNTMIAADYAVAEVNDFYSNIEKTVVRQNLLSGKDYTESVNTPISCSPASESYWSI
jgi:hypothetical protein